MSNYTFRCDRCGTAASDMLRSSIQVFTEHHMRTMHPLYTAEASAARAAAGQQAPPKPKSRRIRSSRVS